MVCFFELVQAIECRKFLTKSTQQIAVFLLQGGQYALFFCIYTFFQQMKQCHVLFVVAAQMSVK
jgi:hypothetical protein